ncbi:MAG TPA: hypothetical protein VE400_20695 [Mycobacterium sp.]|nr:hypothetical protein [Mycobacterium sp.]
MLFLVVVEGVDDGVDAGGEVVHPAAELVVTGELGSLLTEAGSLVLQLFSARRNFGGAALHFGRQQHQRRPRAISMHCSSATSGQYCAQKGSDLDCELARRCTGNFRQSLIVNDFSLLLNQAIVIIRQ